MSHYVVPAHIRRPITAKWERTAARQREINRRRRERELVECGEYPEVGRDAALLADHLATLPDAALAPEPDVDTVSEADHHDLLVDRYGGVE